MKNFIIILSLIFFFSCNEKKNELEILFFNYKNEYGHSTGFHSYLVINNSIRNKKIITDLIHQINIPIDTSLNSSKYGLFITKYDSLKIWNNNIKLNENDLKKKNQEKPNNFLIFGIQLPGYINRFNCSLYEVDSIFSLLKEKIIIEYIDTNNQIVICNGNKINYRYFFEDEEIKKSDSLFKTKRKMHAPTGARMR